jgi:hypothetical protein
MKKATATNEAKLIIDSAVATKAPKAPKVAKAKKLMPIEDYMDKLEEEGELEEGKIVIILKLWIKGYSRKDIISVGYNKVTVYRQVGEYEKLKKAPALNYMGYELYEARIQRLMAKKKISREDAVEVLAQVDMDAASKND